MAEERFPAVFRFYAELNDFLPPDWRGRDFERPVAASQSVKHVIEALGVPHTEIGLLLVGGKVAGFDTRLRPGDRVALLPALRRLIPPGGETPRFAADAHLGRLARYLRFAGFDTLWDNGWEDALLAATAGDDGRIVLTHDRALLMHKAVSAGFFVRDRNPLAQLADVAHRYALDLAANRTARCLECNDVLMPVEKREVEARLLEGTRAAFDAFWQCAGCRRVFWRGSHWKRMQQAIAGVAGRIARGSA